MVQYELIPWPIVDFIGDLDFHAEGISETLEKSGARNYLHRSPDLESSGELYKVMDCFIRRAISVQ